MTLFSDKQTTNCKYLYKILTYQQDELKEVDYIYSDNPDCLEDDLPFNLGSNQEFRNMNE